MIQVDKTEHTFIIRSDEPVRLEIGKGDYCIHIYQGYNNDVEQEPVGCIDTLNMSMEQNTPWVFNTSMYEKNYFTFKELEELFNRWQDEQIACVECKTSKYAEALHKHLTERLNGETHTYGKWVLEYFKELYNKWILK